MPKRFHKNLLKALKTLMNRIILHLKNDLPLFFKQEFTFPSQVYSPNCTLDVQNLNLRITPLSRIVIVSKIFYKCMHLSFRCIEFQVTSLIPIDNHSLRLRWNFSGVSRLSGNSVIYQGTIQFRHSQTISVIILESIHPTPSFNYKPFLWIFSKNSSVLNSQKF
jgi:hypothetical protein